jgi:large subunit ribosomal protein L19
MNAVELVEKKFLKSKLPEFSPGDTIQVHVRVKEREKESAKAKDKDKEKEKEKERIQVFEGVVIGMRGRGVQSSFVVRKISFGVGVERIFPLHSPSIEKIKLVKKGKVRRAKLYYLREKAGRAAKIRESQAAQA